MAAGSCAVRSVTRATRSSAPAWAATAAAIRSTLRSSSPYVNRPPSSSLTAGRSGPRPTAARNAVTMSGPSSAGTIDPLADDSGAHVGPHRLDVVEARLAAAPEPDVGPS